MLRKDSPVWSGHDVSEQSMQHTTFNTISWWLWIADNAAMRSDPDELYRSLKRLKGYIKPKVKEQDLSRFKAMDRRMERVDDSLYGIRTERNNLTDTRAVREMESILDDYKLQLAEMGILYNQMMTPLEMMKHG